MAKEKEGVGLSQSARHLQTKTGKKAPRDPKKGMGSGSDKGLRKSLWTEKSSPSTGGKREGKHKRSVIQGRSRSAPLRDLDHVQK